MKFLIQTSILIISIVVINLSGIWLSHSINQKANPEIFLLNFIIILLLQERLLKINSNDKTKENNNNQT